ncbi:RNA-directed DNA polymerase, eukaryota, reverse transcriptase zinc-binding domain protein [Tanacetum coccineum]
MTNRIKGVLGKLINENQSAFIVGRQITKNILLAQELLRGYNKKTKVKKCALEIDLQKAYDTLDWQFLRKILEQFGFHTMEVFNLFMKKDTANVDGLSFIRDCQGDLTKGKAKISWENICRPKDQGGLGLKNLQIWNKVLIMKHLWNVAAKKDTLWAKWINKVRHHIYYKLGNRKSVSVWYDKWSIEGPLCEFISAREIYDARLSSDCNVASLIQNGNWCWPMEWTSKYHFLNMLQVPSLIDDAYDEVVWVTRAGHKTKFVTRTVWQDMCCTRIKLYGNP